MREQRPPRRGASAFGPEGRLARSVLGSAVLASAFVLGGCFDQVVAPDFETDGRLSVSNDEGSLAQRVAYANDPVPIDAQAPGLTGPAGAAPAMAPRSITLTLVAEVASPTIGSQVIQATSVAATKSDRAVVSYNVRGAAALGALDYFTDLDTRRPRLRSSIEFADSDVNSVWFDDDWAYAAVATADVSFAFPAVLERIELLGNRFRTGNNSRIGLTSFAGTSVVTTNGRVYATSGNGGGVFAFDDGGLGLQGEYALDDARWVAWDQANGRVAVLQGTPGRITVFSEGSFPMMPLASFPFPGADVPESKSTVEVVGGKAFIAAGPEGVQIVCLDNGQIVGSVPRPDPASLGLSPSVVVTNAVTVEGDVMFISNGEAGVYAAAADVAFDQSACDAQQNITMLGRLRFGSLESANHVVLRNDLLFVAAGIGGVKVVDVNIR